MRIQLLAAASCLTLIAGAAQANSLDNALFAAEDTAVAAAADGYADAELASFASAMERIRAVAASISDAGPTDEQQAEMAGAVEQSGLSIERFNAISTAVSQDPVLRARVEVASTPPSAPGSVGASVTDEEVTRFAGAMARMQAVAQAVAGGEPTAEQQAEMASAVEQSGLEIERFNAISTAAPGDASLQARIALAMTRLDAGA